MCAFHSECLQYSYTHTLTIAHDAVRSCSLHHGVQSQDSRLFHFSSIVQSIDACSCSFSHALSMHLKYNQRIISFSFDVAVFQFISRFFLFAPFWYIGKSLPIQFHFDFIASHHIAILLSYNIVSSTTFSQHTFSLHLVCNTYVDSTQ